MRSTVFARIPWLLAALAARPLLAQAVTGTLGGSFTAEDGTPLSGVDVRITEERTGARRTAVSRANGGFLVPLLPAGTYEVAGTLAGFDEGSRCCVTVGADDDVRVKIFLRRSGPLVEPERFQVFETPRPEERTRLGPEEIALLPTKDSRVLDLLLTMPGVAPDPRPGEVSVGGQRGTHNLFLIDGEDAWDGFSGRPFGRAGPDRARLVGASAVDALQVDRGFNSIERNLSGFAVVNLVTKSGTNDLHGSASGLFEDDARRFGSYGASIGGPAIRDRLFLFASYDGSRSTDVRSPALTTSGLPTDADTAAGLASLEAAATPFDFGTNEDLALVKADSEWGSSSHVTARWMSQRFAGLDDVHQREIPQARGHAGQALVKTDQLAVSLTSRLSRRLFEELRLQDVRSSEDVRAGSDAPEAIVSDGGFAFATGRSGSSPRTLTMRRLQATETATLLAGAHTLKGGFDFIRDLVTSRFPGNVSGSYAFESLAAFARNQPSRYVQAFPRDGAGVPETHPDLMRVGVFLEDEWRSKRFTVSLGWRYNWLGVEQPSTENPDPQLLAARIDTNDIPQDTDKIFHGRDPDENDYSVRLGVAYTPRDGTIVRGGYGFYRADPPASVYAAGMAYNGIDMRTLTFTGPSVPSYPTMLGSAPSGAGAPKPSITFFDWDFADPLYVQGTLGIEQRVASDFSVSLTYLGVKGTSLGRTVDANLGTPSTVIYTDEAGRVYPVRRYGNDRRFDNFDRVILFQNTAGSRYDGVTLEVEKRFSHGWQARLSYTFGKVIDTKPDATTILQLADDARMPSDALDPDADRAVGDTDQRHRLVLSGSWRLPGGEGKGLPALLQGWVLSGIVTVASGQPYSATLPYGPASDLNNDGNERNDLAPGTSRNQFRLPTTFSIDPRLTKELTWGAATIELSLQVFNLLNRENVTAVNTVYYGVSGSTLTRLSTFGTPTETAGPRRVQLGARIAF